MKIIIIILKIIRFRKDSVLISSICTFDSCFKNIHGDRSFKTFQLLFYLAERLLPVINWTNMFQYQNKISFSILYYNILLKLISFLNAIFIIDFHKKCIIIYLSSSHEKRKVIFYWYLLVLHFYIIMYSIFDQSIIHYHLINNLSTFFSSLISDKFIHWEVCLRKFRKF